MDGIPKKNIRNRFRRLNDIENNIHTVDSDVAGIEMISSIIRNSYKTVAEKIAVAIEMIICVKSIRSFSNGIEYRKTSEGERHEKSKNTILQYLTAQPLICRQGGEIHENRSRY